MSGYVHPSYGTQCLIRIYFDEKDAERQGELKCDDCRLVSFSASMEWETYDPWTVMGISTVLFTRKEGERWQVLFFVVL